MTTRSGNWGDGDRIELRDLRVVATHGVLPEEQRRPQPFSLDLDLWVDVGAAAISDDLSDAVDYSAAVDAAVAVVRGQSRRLLESLAVAVAEAVLADRRVHTVQVVIRKLRPPVPEDLASAGVRVVRSTC